MKVIPAIDLFEGKAVRLHQGRYDAMKVYDEDPAARAAAWRGVVDRLHVVDLEGARAGRATQTETLAAIVRAFGAGVQSGGGVRTREAFASFLALGVERVVLGSAAVKDPELVRSLAHAHPGVVIVAVDAKDGLVATDGWTEVSARTAIDVARDLDDAPLAALLYTDVARDGTRAGPNVAITAKLAAATRFPVIASGGVGTLDHLRELAAAGIASCIIGRALYEGAFTLEEAVRSATP